jgi:monoamine oxidase
MKVVRKGNVESTEFDVLILGAGAAGLAAAMRLSAAGRRVLVVEARDRIGGRILTVDAEGEPIELGAEFVHGRTPVIFELLERFGLRAMEVDGDEFCNSQGRVMECEFFEEVHKVLEQLKKYDGPDISFEEFLRQECDFEETKRWARSYVAGFHGAPPDDGGVKGIIADTKAEEEIGGPRSWRIEGGYRRLIDCMWQECEKNGVELRLNTLVDGVEWSAGVRVKALGMEFRAPRAIVTLPVGVLQAGMVRFEPELTEKKNALQGLAMGEVARCVLSFRERWWEQVKSTDGRSMERLSFLLSQAEDFPTWWTQAPRKSFTLTAWASAITAPGLKGKSLEEVTGRAVNALAKILGVAAERIRGELVSSHWHDWCSDPLTAGAYTYARVGGSEGYRELSIPLRGTLFFAGEATDSTGNHATVNGAIASGFRAAEEVLTNRKESDSTLDAKPAS